MSHIPSPIRACLGSALAVLTLLAPTAAAVAGEPLVVDTTADHEIGELELQLVDGELQLALEDAIAIALERNLSLEVQRHVRSLSFLRLAEALGIYDINLDASANASEDSSPVVTALVDTGGAPRISEIRSWRTSLSRLLPIGGSLSGSFSNARSATNDTFFSVNPRFDQSLDLTYTQPLLRNRGKTVTERNVIVAHTNNRINREDFDVQVQLVVQQVADTYWQLVEAREQLKVAQESLDLAEELFEMNKIQVEVGTMAPLEVVQSEANVATRQEQIISREAAVHDLEDELRRLLNIDQGPLWDTPIVPTTEAVIPFVEIDTAAAIETALDKRNDLQRKKLEIDNAEVDAKVAANQKRPRLDLTAGYGLNGIGGTTRNRNDGTVTPGGFSDAFNQILDRDFDGWNVGLTFSYPIRNRAAKAQYAQAELQVERLLAELKDLEQQAITRVRQRARAVRTAAQTIESARVSSRLEQENLKAEQKRYENGLSTSLRVVQIQERLSEARSREVAAIASYRRALVAFYLETGELLEKSNVELAGDDEP